MKQIRLAWKYDDEEWRGASEWLPLTAERERTFQHNAQSLNAFYQFITHWVEYRAIPEEKVPWSQCVWQPRSVKG